VAVDHTIDISMSKRFFPALRQIAGEAKYMMIIERCRELYANHDYPDNSTIKRHLIDGILPGLAFYQILRESGESQESALAIIDQAFELLFSNNQVKLKKLGRLPFIYPFLRLYIKPAMRQYPPEGWNLEWIQNDKNAIRFNMKSCFYYDTLSKYAAPELTASFCKVDDFIYENMSQAVKWQRSMTIARGNEYCDFCFASAGK
jgi:hypothetical protein